MYFNTTMVRGHQLAQYEAQAEKQEGLILEFFEHNPGIEFTPTDVHNIMPQLRQAPLTSVRRAISNLTRDGYLVKTDNQIPGLWGKPQYTWKLA